MFGFHRSIHNSPAAHSWRHEQPGTGRLPVNVVNGLPPSLQDPDSVRNWKEFATGMQMLYKHRQRINASVDKIACANLQLLHSNLRASAGFKNFLKELKAYIQEQSVFYHWPLTDNQQAMCSVTGFNKNTGTDTNLKDVMKKLTYRASTGIANGTSATGMYLVVSGKLLVTRDKSATHPAVNRQHKKLYSITTYKTGDVLLMRDDDTQRIVDIRTNQKNTLLFGVYIADSL